jgi:dTDP-4-dehydrorhamnose reductase
MKPAMKILITGADGLVASRVVELWRKSPEVLTQSTSEVKQVYTSVNWQLLTPEINEFDLLNLEQMKEYVERKKPDAVIHFAAFTDVGAAEKERGNKNGLCWRVNVEGTKNLLKTISYKPKAKFIHISTDMVFPGSDEDPGPYPENYPLIPNPYTLTWYGWTKSQAERLVLEAGGTIVRLIYPVRARHAKLDYLRKPLRLFKEGKLYPLFYDQQVSMTFIDELAGVLSLLIANRYKLKAKVYHVSTPDIFSPYQLMKYVLEKLKEDGSRLKKTSIVDFLQTQDNPTRYPIKGGLKSKQTQKILNVKFLKWKKVVDELVCQGLKTSDL